MVLLWGTHSRGASPRAPLFRIKRQGAQWMRELEVLGFLLPVQVAEGLWGFLVGLGIFNFRHPDNSGLLTNFHFSKLFAFL